MNLSLKNGKSYKNTMLSLAVVGLISVVLATVLTSLFVYIGAACFAIFILFDKSKNKSISILLLFGSIIITAAFNILVALYLKNLFYYNICGIQAVVLAAVLAFMFAKRRSKAESVIALCTVLAIFVIIDVYLLLVGNTEVFSFSINYQFLIDTIANVREAFIEQIASLNFEGSEFSQQIFTAETAAFMFDSVTKLWLAFIFIAAFFGTGILCKAFSFMGFVLSTEEDRIIKWHFTTTSIIAYFFCILFIVNSFVSGQITPFSTAIANLSLIFTVIYAYIGFNFAIALLSVRRRRLFSWLLVLAALLIASSLAVQILAFIGVFCTIVGNKAQDKYYGPNLGNGNTDNKDNNTNDQNK